MRRRRWQIIWHRRWIGLGSDGPFPSKGRDRGCLYSHMYRLGVAELRRWAYLYTGPVNGSPA